MGDLLLLRDFKTNEERCLVLSRLSAAIANQALIGPTEAELFYIEATSQAEPDDKD